MINRISSLGLASRLFVLAAFTSSAAFAACAGSSPNIVCSAAGPITLNTTTASDPSPQTASVYPSNNVVSGLSGTITSVQVRLNGLTHNWLHDLDMVLISPSGQAFVFWSDIGTVGNVAPNAITNLTFTISDGAATDLPQGTPAAGSFRPRNYESAAASQDLFPAPAGFNASAANSAAPFGNATFATRFNGANPNGTWQLYIALDSSGPDTGSLASWDLLFATAANNAATTTAVTSSANPVQIPLSGNSTATVTATVTSGGNAVTLGTVTFVEGATTLAGPVTLNGSGQASFTFNTTGVTAPVLGEGIHVIAANYSGATGFGASSGTITQTVDRATQVTGNVFCNTGKITLPTTINTGASVYPSKIFVTGLGGVTQSVIMDLKGFTNPATEDTNLLLVSPTGQKFIPFAFISDANGATVGANIKLDDASGNTLPNSGSVASGTYRPSHGITGPSGITAATFVAPAPAAPYNDPAPAGSATFTSSFPGVSPNGTWSLYAVNWAGGGPVGTREITNGWCLTVGTSSDPATTTTPSVTPSPSAVSQSTTVAALVVNATTSAPVNAQGSVTFKEGNTTLAGPLNLGSNGIASFAKSDFSQGAHFVDALYSGAPGLFGLSSGQVLHYVDAATTNPSAGRFCNVTPLTFPNTINVSASPYPTRINASGLAGTVSKVTVELNGFAHQTPDDLDLMVTGPNGNSLIAFSDVGGLNAVTGLNIVLDSTAANPLPDSTSLASGTFRPNDFEVGTDTFAAPAPTSNVSSASAVTLGTAFNNSNPNGIWTLWTKVDGAGAQGGGSLGSGWCVNLTMTAPVLTISKTHTGNFAQGQTGAAYTVTVGSSGPGSTAGTITVVDTVPTGLTVTAMGGGGWSCTVATRTCTTTAVLASGGSLPPITVTVDVAANATSPQVNSVAVSGGGATGASTTDSTIINQASDLTISKTTSSTFVQGGTATYSLIVNNIGAGPSSGNYTISDTMPTGLTIVLPVTGSTWDCTASTTTFVSCVRSTPIPANVGSAPSVAVNVTIAANAPASITNTATVAGGGELNTANDNGSVTVSVTQVAPDLTVTKIAQGGPFQQGGTVTYLITVTNGGSGPTSGTITMQDTIPTGLTVSSVSGTDWTCTNTQPVVCTRTTPLASAATSVITLSANIAANAPASITNTANISGGGETVTNNNAGTSTINVTAVTPDLTISKVAQGGPFQQGGSVTYLITVTNSGTGPTSGTITMQDTIPTGLTVSSVSGGADWSCTNAQPVVCTRTTPLAAAATSVITLSANIAANAPASITNTANISGGGETVTNNNAGTSTINVTAITPDLTITKVAQGSPFQQGGTVTYLITVTNSGNGPTSGTISMQDTIPTGLTVTSVTGAPDWSCTNAQPVVCTRTSPLAAAATSVITLSANIAANAAASITNTANVSGGGETVTNNNSGSSIISVGVVAPDLTISKTTSSTFQQGGTASYTLTVTNGGNGPTTATFAVSDTIPTGLTIASTPAPAGFDCSASTTTVLSCSSTSALAASATRSITLLVNIAANAPASITNTASVSGGGETVTNNNSGSITVSVSSQTGVTINVPAGISYTFNSQSVTGSQTFQLAPGTYTLSTTTPQSTGVGQRAVFASWSDAGAISHTVTVGSSPLTITGNFTTQFQLTTTAGAGGTVTPATGTFFDSGTVVNLTATPNSGFTFANWTGPVANANAAATTVTMSAPQSVTANFGSIPVAPDVSAQMTVSTTVPAFNRATGRFSQAVTLVNNGTALASSAYVLDNLAAGYAVFAPNGFTVATAPAGSPYVESGPLGAGASITFTIQLTRSGTPALTYTPRVLGAGSR